MTEEKVRYITPTMADNELTIEAIRQIIREELKAVSHEIAKDVAEELTRALRLERNIRNEKERMTAAK